MAAAVTPGRGILEMDSAMALPGPLAIHLNHLTRADQRTCLNLILQSTDLFPQRHIGSVGRRHPQHAPRRHALTGASLRCTVPDIQLRKPLDFPQRGSGAVLAETVQPKTFRSLIGMAITIASPRRDPADILENPAGTPNTRPIRPRSPKAALKRW